ncbi:uncharacterized protein METZ01_LOCUS171724 [marine metagenome]|uniref:Uncharacterized protein n=1 Tax=marine metagenome TaxID=408172 RepID=A0A382BYI8_9ZZZZ
MAKEPLCEEVKGIKDNCLALLTALANNL